MHKFATNALRLHVRGTVFSRPCSDFGFQLRLRTGSAAALKAQMLFSVLRSIRCRAGAIGSHYLSRCDSSSTDFASGSTVTTPTTGELSTHRCHLQWSAQPHTYGFRYTTHQVNTTGREPTHATREVQNTRRRTIAARPSLARTSSPVAAAMSRLTICHYMSRQEPAGVRTGLPFFGVLAPHNKHPPVLTCT